MKKEKYKEITSGEQQLFEYELKCHYEALMQFGPFEKEETYRWFFLRGMDIANTILNPPPPRTKNGETI